MSFSQRVGLEAAVKLVQKDSMDDALRNSLWNEFDMVIVAELESLWEAGQDTLTRNPPNACLFVRLWRYFYVWSLSTLPSRADAAWRKVQDWFHDKANTPWNKVYDFVEFVGNLEGDLETAS